VNIPEQAKLLGELNFSISQDDLPAAKGCETGLISSALWCVSSVNVPRSQVRD